MDWLQVGYQFSSFDEIQAALNEYKKLTEVEFIIRDCRRIESHYIKHSPHANKALVYYCVKYCCVRGGRLFLPRGTGARNRKTWKTGCPAYIWLSISKCRQYLTIKQLVLEHNHKVVPRPLKRTEARIERRRFRIMHRLKISYEEAARIDMINRSVKKNGTIDKDIISAEEIDSMDVETLQEDNSFSPDEELHPAKSYSKRKVDNCYYKAVSYMEANSNLLQKTYKRTDNYEDSSGSSQWAATFNGKRKFKDDTVFEVLGTIEELSSSIGFAVEFLPDVCKVVCKELREIQGVLQDMVIHAGSPESCNTTHFDRSPFPESNITNLENLIDTHKAILPNSKDHILPSGGKGSSALHLARTVCRRAERRVVGLVREQEVDDTTVRYLNRLGDYLFVAAKMVCIASDNEEHVYKKSEPIAYDNEDHVYETPEPQVDKAKSFEIVYLSQTQS